MYRNAAQAAVITGPWQTPVPAAAAPRTPERRKPAPMQAADALRAGLTPAQVMTLEALEIFQWKLAFVRRPLFQAPIPVLFDRDHTRHVVIQEDGSLDESQTLVLRA
ncbi:hypothetical protein [Pseudoxanthomonas sp. Root630]|uniref:hypothetical protein n=1 Tax=Pseudoxanthomonas sp. Root630 TaxID=1736574 RepID=UPI000A56B134|nr:hypothetical protein [Pseudoxanthomonas sp. Root630]